MKTLEWTNIDKATWGDGPWQDEPDKRQWQDEATSLPCLAVRNARSGNWCGYVGVADTHPWHGVGYSGCTQKPPCGEGYCDHYPDVDVHGGLTFADKCADVEGDHSRRICHLPEPGEPDNVWWFGFDCHHSGDLAPALVAYLRDHSDPILRDYGSDDAYRTLAYVERECARLAEQLAHARASVERSETAPEGPTTPLGRFALNRPRSFAALTDAEVCRGTAVERVKCRNGAGNCARDFNCAD